MYSIKIDKRRGRLILTFVGHMDQDPAAFFDELTSAVGQLRKGNNSWDLVADFSETPVMPQDRAENTIRIFAWFIENGLRRGSCVLQSVTQKMQIARVTERNDAVKFFETRDAAERWLDS